MISVSTRLFVNENVREPFLDAARYVAGRTRVVNGCVSYLIFQDVEDANCFHIQEEWVSKEKYIQHTGSIRFRMMLGVLELAECRPVIRIAPAGPGMDPSRLKELVHTA